MFDKAVGNFQHAAKAYVAGLVVAVVAAVGQAGAVSDVNALGVDSYVKALAAAAAAAVAVYFSKNKIAA